MRPITTINHYRGEELVAALEYFRSKGLNPTVWALDGHLGWGDEDAVRWAISFARDQILPSREQAIACVYAPDIQAYVYRLTNLWEDSDVNTPTVQRWVERRFRYIRKCLENVMRAANAAARCTKPQTKLGRQIRAVVKSVTRLIEDLDDIELDHV